MTHRSNVPVTDPVPIVGVVAEQRTRTQAPHHAFFPIGLLEPVRFFLILRSAETGSDIYHVVEDALARRAPDLAITSFGTLDEVADAPSVKGGLASVALTCGFFGLGLYMIGLYTTGWFAASGRRSVVRTRYTDLSSVGAATLCIGVTLRVAPRVTIGAASVWMSATALNVGRAIGFSVAFAVTAVCIAYLGSVSAGYSRRARRIAR